MRNYGNIACAIWQDRDFITLSCNAQRVYLLLITQNNITSVGTLPVTLRRWSGFAGDSPIERTQDGLAELEARAYIAIDWDQEELLIRTFVRWDGGHTNPKRLSSIKASAKAVTSPILAPILAAELTSLGVEHEISFPQVDSHSDGNRMPIERPRVVVTLRTEVPNPQPTTHNPEPQPSSRAASQPDEDRTDVDAICEQLAGRMAANGVKRPTITSAWKRDARLLLDRDGYSLHDVITVIDWCQRDEFWQSNIQSLPKLREKFGQLLLKSRPSTNGHTNGYRQSTSEQRAGQAMNLAAEYEAQEHAEQQSLQIGPGK